MLFIPYSFNLCVLTMEVIVDQARRSLANWFIVDLEVYISIYVQNQNQFG